MNNKSAQRKTYYLIGFVIYIWLLRRDDQLQIDISVQRLNINIVLGILWSGPTINNLDNCVMHIYCLFICYDMYINCKLVILWYVLYLVCSYTYYISTNINSVPVLNGTNFKNWKENVMIALAFMDLDVILRT